MNSRQSLSSSSASAAQNHSNNNNIHVQLQTQAMRQEIHRFESVHPNIYAVYDLLDLVGDATLGQQIREHVLAIEGKLFVL